MPRDGSGTYSLPANTAAVSGDPVSSTKFNTLAEDLESDSNTVRPIVAGGTGASSAAAARTALGAQAQDDLLDDVAALTDPGADRLLGWDDSAGAIGWLTLGTGLVFNGTALELDADLSTLAGLTVAANNFIAGNAGGTAWEVKTPANARTALGLVIGANVQAWDADLDTYAGTPLTAAELGELQNIGSTTISAAQWGYLGAAGGTLWTSANDGAGSGLDADTLDGVQASAFATLSGSNVYYGQQQINANLPAYVLVESDAGADEKIWRLSSANGVLRIQANNDGVTSFVNAISLQRTGDTIDEIELNATLIDINGAADVSGELSAGTIKAAPGIGSVTTGTLTVAGNANEQITATGNITMPANVFSPGDMGIVRAGSAARTITRGSGLTMYVNGTNVSSATLSSRGVMGFNYESGTVVYLTGDVS